MKESSGERQYSLLFMLISLTLLVIATEVTLFLVHYKVSDLMDSLINTSISTKLFSPIIIFPVAFFVSLQLIAYILFIVWIWFITISQQEIFHLRRDTTYFLGLLFWAMGTLDILLLNNLYFPDSFFSRTLSDFAYFNYVRNLILFMTLPVLLMATCYAFINFFYYKRHFFIGNLFLILIIIVSMVALNDHYLFLKNPSDQTNPNIILIGLDSLRPDFTSYEGKKEIKTPYIDHFLKGSVFFREAYTPLARTFPAWMTILTGKHPKNHHARNNLQDPQLVANNETLAKRLQDQGYETIYATDEKRFSNITKSYGFDHVVGPAMGVNDFILGGLSDFPLTNLLINLPIGHFLFPYNYGNRAASITYDPDKFLKLIENDLKRTTNKPLFLAIHLCLSHWPYTWAHDGKKHATLAEQYAESVQGIDLQFGKLMQMLNRSYALNNAYVVLLSDHGTTVGLPGDRIISKKTYEGDQDKLKWITVSKLCSAPRGSLDFDKDYTINTSYGQGTDLLSLKQYQVLLAFKYFGGQFPVKEVKAKASLLDITPTLLDFLKLHPMSETDGISLQKYFSNDDTEIPRPIFMETGDSLTEIETDHIYIEKVIKSEISIYHIDRDGLLFMDPIATQALIKNKQLAVLWGDWLLVRYPARLQTKLVPAGKKKMQFHSTPLPPYFVLANLKTGNWSIGISSPLAKSAPLPVMLKLFNEFYSDEIKDSPESF